MGVLHWQKRSRAKDPVLLLAFVGSLCCKVRFLPDSLREGVGGNLTPLAIFEWSDVFFILVWTVRFIFSERPDYAASLRESTGAANASG